MTFDSDSTSLAVLGDAAPGSTVVEAPGDLVQLLLDEQRTLTAVESFAKSHEAVEGPAQARYYSKLLPASPPGPGQQYGFDVDLDRCSGCKACVTACHSMNGLDEHETWRDVGLLVGGDESNPLMQHVTTACHHCLDPPCMRGCPVDAYEKDPITGIVKHLDDQCFGCEYCTLTCPYDVPKYHAAKGIVRKCDMCSQRLAASEAPACVQACPHEAIAIGLVDIETAEAASTGDGFLPCVPSPWISRPTTTYRTARTLPVGTAPADLDAPRPQHTHLPLVVMLVFTQAAAGTFLCGVLLEAMGLATGTLQRTLASVATVVLLAALGASTLHLGRPLYAFRGMLGWRHSWLSREILVFGAFAGLAVPFAAAHWVPVIGDDPRRMLGWSVVATGGLGVYCSVMIYVFTRRELWSFDRTAIRFGLTSIVLGLATAWSASIVLATATISTGLAIGLVASMLTKLAYDASILARLKGERTDALYRTARLTVGPLRPIAVLRVAAGVVGGVLIPLLLVVSNFPPGAGAVCAGLAWLCCVLGELAERTLFFAAAAPPRMPGGLRT